ncbi:MAG: O-methyltransferase [Pyrinomonadaceae bacterium]
MKSSIDSIIHREQAEYLEQINPRGDQLIAEMEAYAREHQVPIADREVALFLEITVRAIGARRVLEFGTAIGYSAVHIARALTNDGLLITMEPNEEMIRLTTHYLDRAGMLGRVRIERGQALEILPQLNEVFDLIYLDAVKQEYAAYLDNALPLLRPGGVVIVDNVLWGGQVAGGARSPDQQASTEALRTFNHYFTTHAQLRAVILSFGDGIGYAVKLGELS